MLEFLPE